MDYSNDANVFLNDILDDIESNRLPLPSQPDIAIALQELSHDPNVSVEKLNEVISTDPALTARMIRIANSPLTRGRVSINTLKTAISRLGPESVAKMAIGLAMEQLFMTKNKVIEHKMLEAWQHAGAVAAVSYVLASHSKAFAPEEALLAGLLHDIGRLPILSYAEKHRGLLNHPEALEKTLERYSAKLGEAILVSWKFPSNISSVPQNLNDAYRNMRKPDLADIVLVAKIQALSGTTHPFALLDQTEIPAYQRLNLKPNENLELNPIFREPLQAAQQIFA